MKIQTAVYLGQLVLMFLLAICFVMLAISHRKDKEYALAIIEVIVALVALVVGCLFVFEILTI